MVDSVGKAKLVIILAALAFFLPTPVEAEPVVTTGVCAKIAHTSLFTSDPILQADPAMRYWDPILFPGVHGYFLSDDAPYNRGIHGPAHWHSFFGNRSLSPSGISDPGAPTTCSGGFRGSFWTPSLLAYNDTSFPGGIRVDPKTINYTFRVGDRAVVPPTGLGIIAKASSWDCGPGTGATDTPHVCGGSSTIQATLRFPRFWDGVNLHLPNEAHVSFERTADYPVRLPALRVRVDFGIGRTLGSQSIFRCSVNGVPIAEGTPGFPEVGPPFAEDERSFHMDVLFP